ncbi:MAG: PepSY-associated TM helix domain-containing protein [Bryobacteraceae bacterium]
MFQRTRTILLWLHRWVGLAAALLIVVVAGSGVFLVFENEIDRLLNPGLFYVKAAGQRLPVDQLVASVRQAFPKERVQNVAFPASDGLAVQTMLGTGKRVSVDPYTGRVLGSRPFNDSVAYQLRQLHVRLLMPPVKVPMGKGTRTVPNKLGSQIVGWTTVILLGISITGMFVWFPRMAWKLDMRTGWKRINFDLHNLTGLYTLIFAIALAVTGIVMSFDAPAQWIYAMFPAQEVVDEEAAPSVELQRGAKMISFDSVIEAARKTFPTAWIYSVSMRLPGDTTISGQTRVTIHPYTGEVLSRETSRKEQTAAKIIRLMRPIHTGEVFGWPSRIVMALASAMIVAQVVTGVIMWIVRSFKRKRKTPSPEPREEVAV